MTRFKGINKDIDDMSIGEIKSLAKKQKLEIEGEVKRKSYGDKDMTKKKVCICCGKRNPEWECNRCHGGICGSHAIPIDVGALLVQNSYLGLSKHKEHPTFFGCLNDKGEGCAKLMSEVLLWVVKGNKVELVKTKKELK